MALIVLDAGKSTRSSQLDHEYGGVDACAGWVGNRIVVARIASKVMTFTDVWPRKERLEVLLNINIFAPELFVYRSLFV